MLSAGVVLSLVVAISAQQTIEHNGKIYELAPGQGQAAEPPSLRSFDPNKVSEASLDPTTVDNGATDFAATIGGGLAEQGFHEEKFHNLHTGMKALGPDSTAVVSGLVAAFMHRVHLQPGEKACLENNAAQLTGDVMGTVGDIVTAVKALIAGHGLSKSNQGGLISSGMDAAIKVTSLITLATQLTKTCVRGDTLEFLKETAEHLKSSKWMEKRLLVNGVDIAHGLADSVVAFEAQDFRRFGADIGIALRKIMLSNAIPTNSTRTMLPEGVPKQVIIQQATEGLMRGFFVRGSRVEITDIAHPDLDIDISLHKCIAGNSIFFKSLWMAAWDLFAQLSVNANQHGLALKPPVPAQGPPPQPKWSGELMVAMMQFPSALMKCGVGKEMQEMFMEAIKSMQDLHVQFDFPDEPYQKSDGPTIATVTTKNMAKAVEAWTNWDFEEFGFELGTLFRELVLLALPQKYSVDPNGRLTLNTEVLRFGKASSAYLSFVVVGSALVSSVFAIAACRSYRTSSVAHKENMPCEDRLSESEALEMQPIVSDMTPRDQEPEYE